MGTSWVQKQSYSKIASISSFKKSFYIFSVFANKR